MKEEKGVDHPATNSTLGPILAIIKQKFPLKFDIEYRIAALTFENLS